jgi:hypothetical protein
MQLDDEQIDLLCRLVEASRSVPRDRREFILTETMGGTHVIGEGISGGQISTCIPDMEVLARYGLLQLRLVSRHTHRCYVTPEGFAYYEDVKRSTAEPTERVEESVSTHVDSERFRSLYPGAFNKWREAQELLWGADSEASATTIGHLCREAMQEFADAVARRVSSNAELPPKPSTVARLRVALAHQRSSESDSRAKVVDALVAYWGEVADLTQRQEHGAQKEGTPLGWEDARAVVFMCLVVMYEVDRSLR